MDPVTFAVGFVVGLILGIVGLGVWILIMALRS